MDDVAHFASIFTGRVDAFGTDEGKCVRKPVTLDTYRAHLEGQRAIGIYPLLDDGTVRFCCGDIDTAKKGHANDASDRAALDGGRTLIAQLAKYGVVTGVYLERSRSRGTHVWLFFQRPVPAYTARRLLQAAALACGVSVEVFPKQDTLSPNETPARLGNYINLPYVGDGPRDRRVMLDETDQPIALADFLAEFEAFDPSLLALAFQQTPPLAKSTRATLGRITKESMGPTPCFLRLISAGADEGMRNDTAAVLAMHLNRQGRTKDEALDLLERWNRHNRPPLPDQEVTTVLESIYRRDYRSLWCEHPAVAAMCSPTCPVFAKAEAARQSSDVEEAVAILDSPSLSPFPQQITVVTKDPYSYRVIVAGQVLEGVTTRQLINFNAFREVCAEQIRMLPRLQKIKGKSYQEQWEEKIGPQIEAANEEDISPEMTATGRLWVMITRFLTERTAHLAETRTDVLRGRIWIDAGHFHFRLVDLTDWLGEKGYDARIIGGRAADLIRQRGGQNAQLRISGHETDRVRVLRLPVTALDDSAETP